MYTICNKRTAAFVCALAAFMAPAAAHAWTFKVLHTFTGAANDGAVPAYGSLIEDKGGNLYGTTAYGGTYGDGVVFELAPDGTFTVLHSFQGSDGYWPYGGVIRDRAGNLYGTTAYGGTNNYGVVFKLAPDGTETTLHSFTGSDGKWPIAGLTRDKAGNLYGTAYQGGSGDCPYWTDGCGTAFKIAPDGTFTKLHDFIEDQAHDYEALPNGPLAIDAAGNLYGTTNSYDLSAGTVFSLAPDGTEQILYGFPYNGDSGLWPASGPIRDKAGNLYGTAQFSGAKGHGVVFRLEPDGTETTLYSFNGKTGDQPIGMLIRDGRGNLYGTTYQGGDRCNGSGCGVVFQVKADGSHRVLHEFDCADDGGCGPYAGLMQDSAGNLYGTTHAGGSYNQGTVFELVR